MGTSVCTISPSVHATMLIPLLFILNLKRAQDAPWQKNKKFLLDLKKHEKIRVIQILIDGMNVRDTSVVKA